MTKEITKKDLISKCDDALKYKRIQEDSIFQSIVKLSQMQMTANEVKECYKEVDILIKANTN